MPREAKPRWRKKRFGEGADLYLRDRWLGGHGPVIHGECDYSVPVGESGRAPTVADARRRIMDAAGIAQPTSPDLERAFAVLLRDAS